MMYILVPDVGHNDSDLLCNCLVYLHIYITFTLCFIYSCVNNHDPWEDKMHIL